MPDRLHLSPKHRRMLEALLREHLPGVEVWAYGSRVNGRSHDGSDLDLVLRGPSLTKIPSEQQRDFEEAVRESTIPFLVEARDWAQLPERFRREIERDYMVLMTERQPADRWSDMPFSDAVLINPTVLLERGAMYPFVDMAAINFDSRCAHGIEQRAYSGGGSRFRDGDTLMARITPCLENGKIARYRASDAPGIAHGSTEFIVISGRPGVTDTEFTYYLTRWEEVRSYAIGQMTGTSGRQRVPTNSLQHLTVPVPQLREQRAIAHVLGTLDDKIELNRRMNATLEAMARAIFKDWFVDFGPTRAKAEGRDPYLAPEIWDLFPDALIDSQLGKIPEGWEINTLGNGLKELISGSRPRGGAVETGIPSVGAENVVGLGQYNFSKEKYVPAEFFAKLENRGAVVRDGDVLLYKDGAKIGRKTYFDCGFPHPECAVNEHVFILRLRQSEAQRYLFFWLDQSWMTEEIIGLNSNSAQPGINQSGVRGLLFLVPANDVLEVFNSMVGPLTDGIFANCHKSRAMMALRDILLPKLVSGEIRITVAEKIAEAAG